MFTCLCFLFSFVIAPAIHASIETGIFKSHSQSDPLQSFIPSTVGRITASRDFNSDRLIINIQDLHCHAEVQKNVAKILQILDRKYGLEHIYVEGGYGDVDTAWLANDPDAGFKKEVADALLQGGRLSGGEYYSILNNKPHFIKGLEDEKLHKANIVRLEKIIENKDRFTDTIKKMDDDLKLLQVKYLKRKNKKLNAIIEQHKAGEISTEKYYTLLVKYVTKISAHPDNYNALLAMKMNKYPNIAGYLSVLEYGKHIRYKRVTSQLQALLRDLRSTIPYAEYRKFLDGTENFSAFDKIYALLPSLEKNNHISIDDKYPDLAFFLSYSDANKKINPVQLIQEEKQIVEELRLALSQDVAEVEVSFLVDFYGCLKDYLFNKLSADDYQYFIRQFSKFRDIWGKYAFVNHLQDVADAFPLLDEYYAANIQRNTCFLDHFLNTPSSAHSNTRTPCIEVVISGGFHTEGLQQLLEARKVSYLTITPNVTSNTEQAGLVYLDIIKDQAEEFGRNALAATLGSQDAKIISGDHTAASLVIQIGGQNITLSRRSLNDPFTIGVSFKDVTVNNKKYDRETFQTAMAEAVKMAYEIETGILNPLKTADLIDDLIVAFGLWTAREGITGSNGLIWEIARNEGVQKALAKYGEIPRQDLCGLIEPLQEGLAAQSLNDEEIDALGEKNPLLASIIAVPGMRTFLIRYYAQPSAYILHVGERQIQINDNEKVSHRKIKSIFGILDKRIINPLLLIAILGINIKTISDLGLTPFTLGVAAVDSFLLLFLSSNIISEQWGTPANKRYNDISYFGKIDDPMPYDSIFESMGTIFEKKKKGAVISDEVKALIDSVAADMSLDHEERTQLIQIFRSIISDDPNQIRNGMKMVHRLIQGTGYLLSYKFEKNSFVLGKPSQKMFLKTKDVGDIPLYIYHQFIRYGDGAFAGCADHKTDAAYIFDETFNENIIAHEAGHVIAQRIMPHDAPVLSEQIAFLATFLDPQVNWRELLHAVAGASLVQINGAQAGVHDVAYKRVLESFYEVTTGHVMEKFNVGEIDNVLRGLSPEGIADLARKVIRNGGLFKTKEQAQEFIDNVESCLVDVEAIGYKYAAVAARNQKFSNYPAVIRYFNGLKYARKGQCAEASVEFDNAIALYPHLNVYVRKDLIEILDRAIQQRNIQPVKDYLEKHQSFDLAFVCMVAGMLESIEEGFSLSSQGTHAAAILPQYMHKVVAWKNAGMLASVIGKKLAAKELLLSLISGNWFIGQHRIKDAYIAQRVVNVSTRGIIKGMYTGLFVGLVINVLSVLISQGSMGNAWIISAIAVQLGTVIVGGFLKGVQENMNEHQSIVTHFVEDGGLENDTAFVQIRNIMKTFGAVTVTKPLSAGGVVLEEDLDMFTNIVVVSKVPAAMGTGWHNLAQKLDSQPIWANAEQGIVVIASEGSTPSAIEERVVEQGLISKGRWGANNALKQRLDEIARRAGISVKRRFGASMIIDHTGKTKSITYDRAGRMIVPVRYFGDAPTPRAVAALLPQLEQMKRSHERQAKERVYFRDSSTSTEELVQNIDFLKGPTSGNIIIQPQIFGQFHGDNRIYKINEVGRFARNASVSLFIDLSAVTESVDIMKNLYFEKGFAGYIIKEGNDIKICKYSEMKIVAQIIPEDNYVDADTLRTAIMNDRGIAKIIEIKGMKKTIVNTRGAVNQMAIAAFMDDILKNDEKWNREIRKQIKAQTFDAQMLGKILAAA